MIDEDTTVTDVPDVPCDTCLMLARIEAELALERIRARERYAFTIAMLGTIGFAVILYGHAPTVSR